MPSINIKVNFELTLKLFHIDLKVNLTINLKASLN